MLMFRRWFVGFVVLTVMMAASIPAMGQESAVKGSIEGVVVDASGGSVPGAKVTVTGPTGSRTTTTDEQGNFSFPLLIPGKYSVKVEKQGFKAVTASDLEVLTNRVSSFRPVLETGSITETVEVTGSAITVDTTTTSIGSNLNDTFYEKLPIPRGVASLFYLAPGVAGGGASGKSNPSISGGSGLENQYVADGVDITDSAFGGLGIFSRVYGSLGTGINLTFIKEVQVKTGGYEPQYGKSTGGIVQIVTKSGGNEYHGALTGYFQPTEFEAKRTNPDDPQFGRANLTGRLINNAAYDASAELGGYVPKFRQKLFFYAAINPTLNEQVAVSPANSPLFSQGSFLFKTYVYSYSGKLTYKINDKHQIESSIFGDPSHTGTSPFIRLNTDNNTANSVLKFGNRDWATRYNGTFSPTWLVNASFAWGNNHFNETGFGNFQEIIDQTQTGGLPGQRGEFIPIGRGFVEPTEDNTFKASADTSKTVHFWGEHTFTVGYNYEKSFYDGSRTNSGPKFAVPDTNADGNPLTDFGLDPGVSDQSANAVWRLVLAPSTCTLCPYLQVPGITGAGPNGTSRVLLRVFWSEFGLNSNGVKAFSTNSTYHAAYVNDSWTPSRYVTLNLGVRWDQEHLVGQNSRYTFTDNWSPRIGVIVDPWGNRKNKIYANFARYNYNLPLDLAERSLTNELDLFGLRIAPDFTTDASGNRIAALNSFGTVTPTVIAANVLNGASGGVANAVADSFESGEPIFPRTRLTYEDEWVVGFEHEFPQGVVFTAKFIRRDMKRIVEDTGGISPEAALAGISQQFAIGNVSSKTDIFTNPVGTDFVPDFTCGGAGQPACTSTVIGDIGNYPAGCDPGTAVFPLTNSLGQNVTDSNGNTAACFNALAANGGTPGAAVPDGIPDGFPDANHRYWAVEFEVNKSFSKNWQLRANYRIARLFGNFEGALRNDNGQTDPGISSLFDFTSGNFALLGDQFKPGVLNTDRLHIINGFFTYVFDKSAVKGLTLGTGVRIQTGTPINRLAAHPVYENAGEVPIGGRGALGRTPTTGTVDFHGEYPIRITERSRLHLGADLFNIGFARRTQYLNQNQDLGFGTPNVDFLKPANQNGTLSNDAFQSPFVARVFVKFEF